MEQDSVSYSRRKIYLRDRWRLVLLRDLALAANLREFGIKFCSHKHGKPGPIKPRHQRNGCAERSVGFIEVCEMPKIDTQQIREGNPAAHGKNCARQSCEEPLLDVWSQEVKSFHRKDCEPYRNRPVNIWPEQ